MRNLRLIARLDIKGPNLIKGVHLEGLRVIGDPQEYANKYYAQGIDELIYMDSVASLYGRNHLKDIISYAAKNIFVPMTVGGGIRSIDDVTDILRAGADKVAINTAAVARPELISEVARRFGSQCMVLSVEAKLIGQDCWEVYTENGRERTGKDVLSWVKKAVSLGTGEILVTSIDKEGTRKGFDVNLMKAVAETVNVPIIASGGMGAKSDMVAVVNEGGVDAVAIADMLHYNRATVHDIRCFAKAANLKVRDFS